MIAKKQKGDNFERQVAGILSETLGFDCRRVLLSGARGEGDIEGIPDSPVHLECKRQERLRLSEWFAHEKPKCGTKPLALIHKASRSPIYVTMSLEDWCELFREAF